jgi:hemoglobin
MRSLHEQVGGDDTLRRVIHELYERLTQDPRVLHFFEPERLPALEAAQLRWFRSVLGGAPEEDRPDLAAAHARLEITDEQVRAVLGHLDASMTEVGIDVELRRRIGALVARLWLARSF